MIFKTTSVVRGFLLLLSLKTGYTYCFDTEIVEQPYAQRMMMDDDTDWYGLSEFDDEPVTDGLLDVEIPNRAVDPATVMMLLNSLNAVEILQEEFFLRTNILNTRSLLDMPLFDPNCCVPCGYSFDTMLFYNKTHRSYFTSTCDRIDSYLALSSPTLLDKLQTSIGQPLQLDLPFIFSLFSGMTVQERRLGLMFHWMLQAPCGMLRIFAPFYYRERNFFFEKAEQKAIDAQFEPTGTPEEQEKFQNQHFVSDEIGIGDLRLEGMGVIRQDPSFRISLGGFITVPIAFPFKRGLKGTYFPKTDAQPTFDFEALFDLASDMTPAAQNEIFCAISNFVLNAFDRLSANLLDTQLGNNHHVGLGLVCVYSSPASAWFDREWTRRIIFKGRASMETLLPGHERRLYLRKIDVQGFASRNFTDYTESVAASNLLFLEQELINKFYLFGFGANILPGPIFRLTNKMCYEGDCASWFLGTDWWVQTREHLRRVNATPALANQLALKKAKLPNAVQYKVLAGFDYTLNRETCDVVLGLSCDGTIWSLGIGKDYTFVAHCAVRF